MEAAGQFSAVPPAVGDMRIRPLLRCLAHVGRGIGLWGLGAYLIAYAAGMGFIAVSFFAEALRIGGIPELQEGVILVAIFAYMSALPCIIAAGAGLVFSLVTLPLAGRPPRVGVRVTGVLVAVAAFTWGLFRFNAEPLTFASMTAWHVGVIVVVAVAAWFGAPWLWPKHLREAEPRRPVLPPPHSRDRIRRPFGN